jgi:hypothetical protein
LSGEIESKNVALKQFLVNHLIENWLDATFSESWIGHTDNSFEVISSEDSLLFLDITEFLVLNVNLSA